MTKKNNNYKDSGVNVQEGQNFISDIKNKLSSTSNKFSIGTIGGFSGYIDPPKNYKDPLYALACDGVGTKLRIASLLKKYDSLGIDLVAMCVNDLIVSGAKPLAFLDYYGVSKLDRSIGKEIISGIISGCEMSGCDLVGGETAEMPNHYTDGNFDLVGFAMGVNERDGIIDGSTIAKNNCIIGLKSNGLHSNGFSLVNNIINANNLKNDIDFLEQLLAPTKIYVNEVLDLLSKYKINGMAHITGGGLEENLSRAVPENLSIVIDKNYWENPEIFQKIQKLGNIQTEEMLSVFNCGVGYCLIVDEENSERILSESNSYFKIGLIKENLNKKFLIK